MRVLQTGHVKQFGEPALQIVKGPQGGVVGAAVVWAVTVGDRDGRSLSEAQFESAKERDIDDGSFDPRRDDQEALTGTGESFAEQPGVLVDADGSDRNGVEWVWDRVGLRCGRAARKRGRAASPRQWRRCA